MQYIIFVLREIIQNNKIKTKIQHSVKLKIRLSTIIMNLPIKSMQQKQNLYPLLVSQVIANLFLFFTFFFYFNHQGVHKGTDLSIVKIIYFLRNRTHLKRNIYSLYILQFLLHIYHRK